MTGACVVCRRLSWQRRATMQWCTSHCGQDLHQILYNLTFRQQQGSVTGCCAPSVQGMVLLAVRRRNIVLRVTGVPRCIVRRRIVRIVSSVITLGLKDMRTNHEWGACVAKEASHVSSFVVLAACSCDAKCLVITTWMDVCTICCNAIRAVLDTTGKLCVNFHPNVVFPELDPTCLHPTTSRVLPRSAAWAPRPACPLRCPQLQATLAPPGLRVRRRCRACRWRQAPPRAPPWVLCGASTCSLARLLPAFPPMVAMA